MPVLVMLLQGRCCETRVSCVERIKKKERKAECGGWQMYTPLSVSLYVRGERRWC